jgi:hypothetical protein
MKKEYIVLLIIVGAAAVYYWMKTKKEKAQTAIASKGIQYQGTPTFKGTAGSAKPTAINNSLLAAMSANTAF